MTILIYKLTSCINAWAQINRRDDITVEKKGQLE